MKQNFKKLMLAFIATSVFTLGLYYIVNIYDTSGTTILWIQTNIQYLMFLYISIIISLALYSNKDKKSKLILSIIVLLNFLFVVFFYVIFNLGLNNIQGFVLLGFLILAFISNYIKNWFGHSITIISVLGIIITIGLTIIPTYNIGPDLNGFESQFNPQIIVYSKVNINKSKAYISFDKKILNISNGILNYDLKTNNSGSQVLFISDQKYLNTYGYILFPNKELIQIYPQSAININKINDKYEIEIITGIVKQNTTKTSFSGEIYNNKYFYFTGGVDSFGVINEENIKEIDYYYNQKQKEFVLNQVGGDILKKKVVLSISKNILEILNKILPGRFGQNIQNFNDFQKYIDTSSESEDLIKFDTDNINKGIIKEFSESLENTKIIK